MARFGSLSHAQLSNWYALLGRQVEAGIGLAEALRQSEGPPEKDRVAMAHLLERGSSLDQVLSAAPVWLPLSDRFLLSAGGNSGTLPEMCERLSSQHQQLARHQRDLIGAAIYPVIVLHAVFLFWPFILTLSFSEERGITLDSVGHALFVLISLSAFWGLLLLYSLVGKRLAVIRWFIARLIPGLAKYRFHRSIARFCSTLDSLLAAAVPIKEAFGGAALAADHRQLTPALLQLLPSIENGRSPGDGLERVPGLPPQWIAFYQTGERTGSLDRSLQLITRQAEEIAQRTLRAMAFWYPKLLFLAVAFLVAFTVARVYSQYLEFIGRLSSGNW